MSITEIFSPKLRQDLNMFSKDVESVGAEVKQISHRISQKKNETQILLIFNYSPKKNETKIFG